MITKQRFERKGKRKEKSRKGNPLQFNVAQFLKHPGTDARHYIIEQATLADFSNEFMMSKPLNGQVKFVKTGKNILVTGTFETELTLPCTRCLTDTRVAISFEIEETFTPTVDIMTGAKLIPSSDADEATLITEQHILDLTEVIRQEIYLSAPTQVLCQPDCLGLCPHCGANRNLEPCHCEVDQIDIRWAGLLALKDDFS